MKERSNRRRIYPSIEEGPSLVAPMVLPEREIQAGFSMNEGVSVKDSIQSCEHGQHERQKRSLFYHSRPRRVQMGHRGGTFLSGVGSLTKTVDGFKSTTTIITSKPAVTHTPLCPPLPSRRPTIRSFVRSPTVFFFGEMVPYILRRSRLRCWDRLTASW